MKDFDFTEYFRENRLNDDSISKLYAVDAYVDEMELEEVGYSDFFAIYKELFDEEATEDDYNKWLSL